MKKIINQVLPLAYGTYFNILATIAPRKSAVKAFYLFCTPRKGKVLPHQIDFLERAKAEKLAVNDLDIQTYRWLGQGPTVLLMHGWESNAFRWRNLIEKLQQANFNIIAFDAPAHGHSSGTVLNVPVYTACTNTLIELLQPDAIIGHSIGGMTALYSQHQQPNTKIKKVVSLGAPSDLKDIISNYQNLLKFNNRVLEALNLFFIEKFNFGINEFSIAQFAQNISKEGLIVHDEEDAIAPFSAAEKIHANWKNSILLPTKGLGHSLHQDTVNDKVIAFLQS